jgi:hypothetical protein
MRLLDKKYTTKQTSRKPYTTTLHVEFSVGFLCAVFSLGRPVMRERKRRNFFFGIRLVLIVVASHL